MNVRPARPGDAESIAAIHNQGIQERQATFETRPRSAEQVMRLIAFGDQPLLVAELDGGVVGWARLAPYSEHPYYSGVAEASVYVAPAARRGGVGTALVEGMAAEAAGRGLYKIIGKLFTANTASIGLVRRCGFREVGVHVRHGRLDGSWRDVLLVERLLGEAADDQPH